jgi:hypothetical protein
VILVLDTAIAEATKETRTDVVDGQKERGRRKVNQCRHWITGSVPRNQLIFT